MYQFSARVPSKQVERVEEYDKSSSKLKGKRRQECGRRVELARRWPPPIGRPPLFFSRGSAGGWIRTRYNGAARRGGSASTASLSRQLLRSSQQRWSSSPLCSPHLTSPQVVWYAAALAPVAMYTVAMVTTVQSTFSSKCASTSPIVLHFFYL